MKQILKLTPMLSGTRHGSKVSALTTGYPECSPTVATWRRVARVERFIRITVEVKGGVSRHSLLIGYRFIHTLKNMFLYMCGNRVQKGFRMDLLNKPFYMVYYHLQDDIS